MAKPILMPQVGQDLTEGKLIELHVSVGDAVSKGDIVAVVESEKASFEVEAFEAGTVLEILYAEGEMTAVLEPLMFVGEPGDQVSSPSLTADEKAANNGKTDPLAGSASDTQSDTKPANSAGVRSSPLARRLAREHGIDITTVKATGTKGSVVKRDILAAVEAAASHSSSPDTSGQPAAQLVRSPAALPPADREDREEPFDRMRQVIAERLTLAKQTIPHFYLRAEADVSDLQVRRAAFQQVSETKISINDVIIHAAALTLLEHPRLNAHVADDRVIIKGAVNVGMAVSVDNGLMVQVIENAHRLTIQDIATLARDYAAAARRGMSKTAAPGTFSISNLGMFGVDVWPIINPPEAAILGVGPVKDELRPHRGGIRVCQILPLTLAADHRAVDGALGAQFLQGLTTTIQNYRFGDEP